MSQIENDARVGELRRTEDARLAAMVAGDLAAIAELLDPDLHYTHSTGRVDDRASLLALLASGATRYLELSHDFTTVTFEGDVAVVEGLMKLHLISAGTEKQLRTTNRTVWSQSDGQWKLKLFSGSKNA